MITTTSFFDSVWYVQSQVSFHGNRPCEQYYPVVSKKILVQTIDWRHGLVLVPLRADDLEHRRPSSGPAMTPSTTP